MSKTKKKQSNAKKQEKKKGLSERSIGTIYVIIGLLIFLVGVFLNNVWICTLIVAAVSAVATYEFTKAAGAKSKLLFAVSSIVSFVTVFLVGFGINVPHVSVLYSFYVLIMLCITVVCHEKIKYIDTVAALFASVALPYSLSCFIRLNNIGDYIDGYTHLEGIYLVLMALSCSWLTDVFAFAVGRKFGKHKMTPKISPKKSVEGAVGGVVITAAVNAVVLLVFSLVAQKMGRGAFMDESNLKYLYIIPISMVLSVISMFGDLAASVLKRNAGIKDYSNILHGHGGIMDRFDSTLFVLPVLYGIFVLIF